MLKAVIETGSKQYLIVEGQSIVVELLKNTAKTVDFQPLLVLNDDNVKIGQPYLEKSLVTAEVINADIQSEKVTAIRYKAKKRVHKVRGHRQHQTELKIVKIKA